MDGFQKFMLLLGLFEFFAATQYLASPREAVGNNALIPISFAENPSAVFLYVAYILTLGLQRLTYALAAKTTWGTYAALVGTHFVEVCLWWSLALQDHVNPEGLPLLELAKEVAQGGVVSGFTSVVLLGTPVLFLMCVIFAKPSSSNEIKRQLEERKRE